MVSTSQEPLGAEDLREILAEEPFQTLGNFQHREVGDDGVPRCWQVSLAAGLGWLTAHSEYRRQFGKAPGRISRYYSYTRTLTLKLAKKGRPLPEPPPDPG